MVVYSLGKIAFVVASFLLLFRIFIIIFRYHNLTLVGKFRWGPWSLLKIEFTLLPITVSGDVADTAAPSVRLDVHVQPCVQGLHHHVGRGNPGRGMGFQCRHGSPKVIIDQVSKSKPLLSYWPWLRIGRGDGHPSPSPYCPTDHGKGLDGITHCDSPQGYLTRP